MPERFHWVVPGRLAGMSLPGRIRPLEEDLREIHRMGIRAVATLTERPLDPDAVRAAGLVTEHFPIDDFGVPTIEQTKAFCAFVDARNAESLAVAAHCFAGLGRTGTMIACFLARSPETDAERVLRTIRRIEPGFVQVEEQERFVAVWERYVKR